MGAKEGKVGCVSQQNHDGSFWDGIIHIDYLQKATTINKEYYNNILARPERTTAFGQEECAFPPRQYKGINVLSSCCEIYRIIVQIAHSSTIFSGISVQFKTGKIDAVGSGLTEIMKS